MQGKFSHSTFYYNFKVFTKLFPLWLRNYLPQMQFYVDFSFILSNNVSCIGKTGIIFTQNVQIAKKYLTKAIRYTIIIGHHSKGNGERARTALQRQSSVLFAVLFLPCVSKAAASAAKIPRTLLAEMCEAVLAGRIFVQTRKRTQEILCGFSRTMTKCGRKSAR